MTAPDRDPVTLARYVIEADDLIRYVDQAIRDDTGVTLEQQFKADDDEQLLQDAAPDLARAVIALTAERDAYREENARYREKIARMEALADRLDWEASPANHSGTEEDWGRVAAAIRIRAALNGEKA